MALSKMTPTSFISMGSVPSSLSATAVATSPQSLVSHSKGCPCQGCSHAKGCRCQGCSDAATMRHAADCSCIGCSSVAGRMSVAARGTGMVANAALAAGLASGAMVLGQRRQRRRARMQAAPSNFYEVMKAEGEARTNAETAQDRVFSWLGRAPKPGSDCFKALHKYFPGALPGAAVHLRSKDILEDDLGMVPKNTLLGTSFCPDEINNGKVDIGTVMRSYWGSVFPMGGISGTPFVGETGFKAFASHVAQDGHIILVFGPHVGVSESGEIGQYLREGQSAHSSACGAVIGAYKASLAAGNDGSGLMVEDIYDMQMDEIKQEFAKYAEEISKTESPMAACAYQAYEMVKDRILKIVNTKFGSGKLVLIGGIQINMPHDSMDDHFLPLMFEVRQAGQETVDLMDRFVDVSTQSNLQRTPWASLTAQRETFAWLTWSPPATSPVYHTLHKYFPGALPSQAMHERKRAILKNYGFVQENTLMGTSLCPDEINNDLTDLPVLMQEHWGESFPMGGISGAPFTGKTGFKAFSSHVPQDGNIIILFGPHVGISGEGEVGSCLRDGQYSHSAACGAVIGAYKACLAGDFGDQPAADSYDKQMDWIKRQLAPHVKEIAKTENPMAALSHQSYAMVRDKLFECVDTEFGSGWLCLVGGIQINLPDGLEDHFLPCTFDMRKAGEKTIDLLHELTEFQMRR